MNPQDKSFLTIFTGLMTVLVLLATAIFLISRSISLFTGPPDATARKQMTAEERIKPVGQVVVAEPGKEEAAPAVERTGEEIVASVCSSCHATGVLGAPTIGDKEAWAARFERGLDALVQAAITGVRAMPPKGGDPNLTESDIQKSVTYMLQESGIEVAAAAEAAPAVEGGAPAGVDLAQGKEVYSNNCFACHDTGAAGAPKMGDQAAWQPRAEQGFETLVSHAVNGFKAMPAKGGNPNLSDAEVSNATAYILDQTDIKIGPLAETGAAAAPEEPAKEEAPTAPEEAESAAPEPAAEPAPQEVEPTQEVTPAPAEEETAAPGAQQEVTPALPEEEEAPAARLVGPETAVPAGQEPIPHVPSKPPEPPAQEEPVLEIPGEEPAPVAEEKAPTQEEAAPAQEPTPSAPEQMPSEEAPPAEEETVPPQETTSEPKLEQAAAPAAEPLIIPDSVDPARGKQLYNTACIVCHGTGVAGAPKLDDQAAWEPRLAKGFDTLSHNAINGYKAMPPKGGRMEVPDEEIISAVGYMVSEVQ